MTETHLSATDVHCRPGAQELFHGLSLTVSAGDTIELRGPNGCGKSTLLRILAGLQQPDSGQIARLVDPIGYLGHKFGVSGILTVRENIRWTSTLCGTALDQERVWHLLELFQLETATNTMIQELSAGQKRRCSFVCLSVGDYSLWLLDEPFSSLDDRGEELVRNLIQEHCENGGSVVVATHTVLPLSHAKQIDLGCD